MFCTKCGAKVDDDAKFCQSCGNPINVAPTAQQQEHMQPGAGNNSSSNEAIITQNKVQIRINGGFLVSTGTAILTNHRIVFKKISLGKLMLLGPIAYLQEGNFDFEIPYSEIKSVNFDKELFVKAITIITNSGDKYKFMSQAGPFGDFTQEWYDIIQQHR